MAKFSRRSERLLETCCPEIQMVMREAIKHFDFSVISGRRGEREQAELYERGLSKKQWPDSKHNVTPLSEGIDVAPFPIDWKDVKRFYFLAGVILTIAEYADVKLRWGGDWDSDKDFSDQTFFDLGHFEKVEE